MAKKKKMPDGGKIGPINFLNSYYQSPEFKRKSGSNYDVNMIYFNKGSKMYVPEVVNSDEDGSHAVTAKHLMESRLYDEKGNTTIVLDKSQAKKEKYDLYNEVLPHEFTHTTRKLDINDESQFVKRNKDSFVKTAFERYKTDPSGFQSGRDFSEWSSGMNSHEQLPNENYADLNSLRWNLYKNNIYDASKGPMTIDHIKKAMKDPKVKDGELFKRLLRAFSPEDLVELNNTIADNNKSKQVDTAENGISMGKKFDYKVTIDEVMSPLAAAGIYIKPENKGKFNATKKATGKSTEELTHSSNPVTKKRAIFAQNAAKWHHAEDGDTLPSPIDLSTVYQAAKSKINTGLADVGATGPKDIGDWAAQADPLKTVDNQPAQKGPNYGAIGLGFLGAIDTLLPYDRPKKATPQIPQAYNPYTYGTGSQAIMDNGGYISSKQRKTDGFIGPLYDDGGPIKQKGVAQMTDAEVHNELNRPVRMPGDLIKVIDNRRVHPVSGKPMQAGNKSTYVNSDILKSITAQAKAKGVDPNNALAISLQESEFGNSFRTDTRGLDPELQKSVYDESMKSLGQAHAYLPDEGITNATDQGANSLAKALKEKMAYAKQLGIDKRGEAYSLQTYNGLGKLGPKNFGGAKTIYGMAVSDQHPLDLRENPAYGKTVLSLRDQVIKTNPAIEDIVNKTPAYQPSMDNGGSVEGQDLQFHYGGDAKPISYNPYAGPTLEFKGPSHEDGGIGISYGGKNVEVEGAETGVVGQDGELNVMGNMVLPGTNTKFKSLSKKIAGKENTTNKRMIKAKDLMDTSDPDGIYDYMKFNSGRAMMIGSDMKMKQLAQAREKLSGIQRTMLETADRLGVDPQDLSKGIYTKAKNGIAIYADGGDTGPGKGTRSDRNNNPGNIKYGSWAKAHGATGQDKDGFAIFTDQTIGLGAMKSLLKSKQYNGLSVKDAINKWTAGKPYKYDLGTTANKKVSDLNDGEFDNVVKTMRNGEGTNYGVPLAKIPKTPTGNIPDIVTSNGKISYNPNAPTTDRFSGEYQQVTGDSNPLPELNGNVKKIPSSTKNNGLNIDQIAGEIYGIASNQVEPVGAQKYQPQLYQPYQVSFQDRINDNQSTFTNIAKQLDYNPSALASLGAQKYNADNAVRAEEFRTNQGIANDVTNKNVSILNDAALRNQQIADTQMVRQATAKSKTKATTQEALNSISSKILQNDLENRRTKMYESLFDYRTDDQGDLTYQGPDAVFNTGSLGGVTGSSDDRTKRIYDKNGNIKETQKTALGQTDEQLKALKLYQQKRKTYLPPR